MDRLQVKLGATTMLISGVWSRAHMLPTYSTTRTESLGLLVRKAAASGHSLFSSSVSAFQIRAWAVGRLVRRLPGTDQGGCRSGRRIRPPSWVAPAKRRTAPPNRQERDPQRLGRPRNLSTLLLPGPDSGRIDRRAVHVQVDELSRPMGDTRTLRFRDLPVSHQVPNRRRW